MAAGLATLRSLDDDAYRRLEARSAELEAGLRAVLEAAGVAGVVQRVGSMLTLFFRDRPVRSFADTREASHTRFASFFHGLLDRGVHLPPSGYEAWFVSLAHDAEAIRATLDAARAALTPVSAVTSLAETGF